MTDQPIPPSPSDSLDYWLQLRRRSGIAGESATSGDEPATAVFLGLDRLMPSDTSIEGICSGLASYVRGQEQQLRQISVLLSMHLAWTRRPDPLHTPPNALVLGPTGSGKTFTLERASRILNLPFVSIDTTKLSPSEFVGLQIKDVLHFLETAANDILEQSDLPRFKDDDIKLAERGVLFFDEFDK